MDRLAAIAEDIHQAFEARTAARDHALSQARTLTRFCANAIRSVHRDDFTAAEEQLENASNQLTNVYPISADITKEEEVKVVVEKTIEKFGRLDILVNNAGIFPKIKQLHEISDLEWNEVLNVNLNGQFRFTKFSSKA